MKVRKLNKAELIRSYVSDKIKYLYQNTEQGSVRGTLANLRHGIGKVPGELPELWGILFDRLPEELCGTGTPSPAEWAVYTAMTLYAMHQQGNEECVHTENISIGGAAAELSHNDDDIVRLLNRMRLIATAVSPEDLSYHLRGLIQLLKGESIKLDYAKLAEELFLFRFPETANRIRIQWGRDFYRVLNVRRMKNEHEQTVH